MYTRTGKNKKRLFIIIVVVVIISVLTMIITLKRRWNRKTNFDEEISMMMTDETFMSLSMDSQAEQIIAYLNDAADNKIVNSDGNTILKDSISYDDASGTIFYCVSQGGMYAVSLKSANTMEFQSNANLICNEISNGDMDWDDMDETDTASILLLYGAEHDDHMENYIELINEYGEQGINVQIDDSVTVEDYMMKMDDADIVIIASHGIYTSYKKYDDGFIIKEAKIVYSSMICTDDVVTDEKNKLYRDDINNYRIVRTNSIGTTEQYYWILPEFFTYHYGTNDMNGEYIHLSCCQSFGADMRNGSEVKTAYCDLMASAFIDCGAEVVAGYYNTVFKSYDYSMLTEILNNLFDNKSISDAIMAAEYENGTDDGEFAQKIGWLNEDNEYYDEVKTRLDESGAAHIEMLGNEQYVINVQLLNTGNITGDEALEIWNTFIQTGNYTEYTKEDNTQIWEYVIYDINDDEIPELLIQEYKEGDGWCNTWLFTLDEKEIVLACQIYGYGSFRYSPSNNAIAVSPEFKLFEGTSCAPFYKLSGITWEYAFTIYQDGGIWFYSDASGDKEISDDERENYYDDIVYFEWKEIKTDQETDNLSSSDLCNSYWKYRTQQNYLYVFEENGIVAEYNEIAIYEDLEEDIFEREYEYSFDGINLVIYDYRGNDGCILKLCNSSIDIEEAQFCGINEENILFFYEIGWVDDGSPSAQPICIEKIELSDEEEAVINWFENLDNATEQASGEETTGSYDGIYYLESMSYAGEVMSASELGMEDIGLKVSYGRCEFIGGESVGLANSGSSDIIFSSDTVTIIDSDGATIYGKYDGDAIILDASGVEMIFSRK